MFEIMAVTQDRKAPYVRGIGHARAERLGISGDFTKASAIARIWLESPEWNDRISEFEEIIICWKGDGGMRTQVARWDAMRQGEGERMKWVQTLSLFEARIYASKRELPWPDSLKV